MKAELIVQKRVTEASISLPLLDDESEGGINAINLTGQVAEDKRIAERIIAHWNIVAEMRELLLTWWTTDMDDTEFFNRACKVMKVMSKDLVEFGVDQADVTTEQK